MNRDDQGEKIITLARAMLAKEPPPPPRYSLKVVALVALLSAGTATTSGMLAAEYYRPLNRYEKTELRALLHYAAKIRQEEPAKIEELFRTQFGITALDDLHLAQLDEARQFLQRYIRAAAP